MSEKKIEIGGRLHSIATGNVLAGANEIFDDDKNKKQSEINTETYSLVNDVNERLNGLSPDQQSALTVAAKATNNETKLGYYVCGTEGNVAAKVISDATGYILSKGGSMKVKMTNANTAANATLNINSTGAKPLYYDGERASVNNSWEAGETVEVYYDGTNYYANNVAGGSGSGDGAFDISAKTGQNYETLTAALTAANTILPASKKKGGMSIKFIQTTPAKYTVIKTEGATEQPTGTELQSDPGIISGTYTAGELSSFSTLPATLNSSLTYYLTVVETVDEQEVTTYTTWVITYVQSSDNKYMQYRLMADTFNTTLANWQGVDDKPINGSKNLVESGGVAIRFNDITGVKNYIENNYINTAGKIRSSEGYFISNHIPAKKGDVVKWDMGPSLGTGVGLNVYDENEDNLAVWSNTGASVSGTRTLTISNETAAYIVCSFIPNETFEHKVYVNGELVWIKQEDGKLVEIENTLNAIVPKAEKSESLDREINNRMNVSVGIQTEFSSTGEETRREVAGWNTIEEYIPIHYNDVLRWVIGGSSSGGKNMCAFFDAEYNLLYRLSDNNRGTSGPDARTINVNGSIPNTVAYVRLSYYYKLTDETDNLNPVVINGVSVFTPVFENGIGKRVEDIEAELHPSLPAYGEIGKNYAKQIPDIVDKLSYRFSNRFHFLHISDNHNTTYGYANELLDFIPAKFLINTGDLVNDKFTDSKTNTIACSISPTKPVYLVLGNHDYSHATSKQDVFDAFYGDAETEGTVNYHNVQTGGVATDKTYYSVDFTTEGVKCIMLDLNEGHTDEELPGLNPNTAIYGKMSQTQIEWFAAQLQDAITNNLHVVVFIHAIPSNEVPVFGKTIDSFLDLNYDGYRPSMGNSLYTCYRLDFLLDIVDAFINGSSVTFTYSEHEYSFTFASAGHFVAWFAGHQHQDCCGWLTGHENQFAVNVCRPTKDSGNALGTYDGDRLGVHFNYVTIDKGMKSLSVYRVGQQDTVYATQRKSFRILYK